MKDFGKKIEEQRAMLIEEEARAADARAKSHAAKKRVEAAFNTFNEGTGHIRDAVYLSDESKFALCGLLATYEAAGISPEICDRGTLPLSRWKPRRFAITIYEHGWIMPRTRYEESVSGMSEGYRMRTASMIVTPDERIMPTHHPATDWARFGGSRVLAHVPVFPSFPGESASYSMAFDNTLIVRSVVEQVAKLELPWVDPS
jgi:hypothetical protein